MAGDNVHEIANAPRRVINSIQMNMDATSGISEPARFTQTPHQTLQRVNIFPVKQYRADQLYTVSPGCGYDLSLFLPLTVDAAVIHKFPNSSIRSGDTLCIVIVAQRMPLSVQVSSGNIRRFLSGDACELDFDAKMIGKQTTCPHIVMAKRSGLSARMLPYSL